MPEVYATGSDGKKYRTRADYEAGRFQSMGTNAAHIFQDAAIRTVQQSHVTEGRIFMSRIQEAFKGLNS